MSVTTIDLTEVCQEDHRDFQIPTSQSRIRIRVPAIVLATLPVITGVLMRLTVALVWLGNTQPYNDAADYFEQASILVHGAGQDTAFYWPPGTTYYLAGWFSLLGTSVMIARIAVVALSTLQIPVTGLLTWQATRSRHLAMLACWMWAVYPPSVFLVSQPFSQHLAALSLALIALCGISWIRTRSQFWLPLMGLCVGIGCLTRPSMVTVGAAAGAFIILVTLSKPGTWAKRAFSLGAHCLLFGLPAFLIVSPTVLYNARCGAGYTLSTNNERNFFLGNNPYTPWYKTGLFAQRRLDELPENVQTYLRSMYNTPNRRLAMAQAAAEHIRQNPGLAALRTFNRACAFWGFDYLASRVIMATTGSRLNSFAVLMAEAVGYCAIMMLALVGLVFWKNQVNGVAVYWLIALVAAYAFPYCLAFSGGTYHFPVIGLMIPLAVTGLKQLANADYERLTRSRILWTVIVLFIAIQVEYAYFTLAAGISREPETRIAKTAWKIHPGAK